MSAEENLTCPKCGASVSKEDTFCKNCGAEMPRVQETAAPSVPPYERKFSVIQRFWKLLVSPSEAMRDIVGAPDYAGGVFVVALYLVVLVFGVIVVSQKIRFLELGSFMGGFSALIIVLFVVVALVTMLVRVGFWLLKSLLVKSLCDDGSGWSFKVAAAVTGYSYIADVLFSAVQVLLLWLLLPNYTISFAGSLFGMVDSAKFLYSDLRWFMWGIGLPLSFLGLIWKSWLGRWGTYFGTKEKCSLRKAFVVYFLLGLIVFLFLLV